MSNKWIKNIFEPVKVITSQVTSINRMKMGMSTLRHRKKEIIISTKYFYQIGNFKNFLTKIFEIHCKFENRNIDCFYYRGLANKIHENHLFDSIDGLFSV